MTSLLSQRRLYEQAQSLFYQMRAILDAAEAEERDLTAEELEQYKRLETELDRVIEQRQVLASAARAAEFIEELRLQAQPVVADGSEDVVSRAFRNYLRHGLDGLDDVERRALGVSVGASGGYLVPQTLAADFVRIIDQYSAIRQLTTPIVTQTGEAILIPIVDDTSNVGAIVAENTPAPEQDTTFAQKALVAYKYTSKRVKVSLELLTDAAYRVDQLLFQLLGERIGRAIEQHYITGTGTNQPEGLLTNAVVGKTTAANNAITYDELVDLVHSLDPAYRANAVMLMHDSTVQAIRKLKDSTGQPLWQPSLADVAPGTILGYRYITSPYMPQIGSQAKVIAFGDIRAAYVIRDVQGIELVRSDRAVVESYQVEFNAWFRTGGVLQNTRAVRLLQMAL